MRILGLADLSSERRSGEFSTLSLIKSSTLSNARGTQSSPRALRK